MWIKKCLWIFGAQFLFILSVVTRTCGADDGDNVNWQVAAGFVDTLQYKKPFVDSLKCAFNVAFPQLPLRTVAEQSFAQGETLVYDIGWGPFKAGYVILTAVPDEATHTIRLDGKALSRGFVSTFYRMRDNVISTIDADGLYPLFFEQHLREGKHYKADTWILYDHLRDSVHIKDGKLKTMSAPKFTNDYLSIFFYLRSRSFGPGDTFSLPIFVDKKLRTICFFCKGRDTIDLDGKSVPCLDMLPRISDDKGTFNKKNGFEIWLTDDAVKMPVKIKSKISLGSINAKLVYAFRPEHRIILAAARTTGRKHDSAHTSDTPRILDSAKRLPSSGSRDTQRSSDTAPHQFVKQHDSSKSAETLKVPDTNKRPGASQCIDSVKLRDSGAGVTRTNDSSTP